MNNIINAINLKNQGLNAMAISRLVRKEAIGNLGYGFYTNHPNNLKLENDDLMLIINKLLDNYPFAPKRVVFSSISLNFCINQLISSTTYIVEVEKEYLQSVFMTLKNNFNNVILLKPTKEDKLNYWAPNAIYVVELFKRSPVNKDGSMAIEKLIVDLLFDENTYSLYSGHDIDSAIDILCSKYTINYKTLFFYATRKNRRHQLLERINKYIPKEILEVISHD